MSKDCSRADQLAICAWHSRIWTHVLDKGSQTVVTLLPRGRIYEHLARGHALVGPPALIRVLWLLSSCRCLLLASGCPLRLRRSVPLCEVFESDCFTSTARGCRGRRRVRSRVARRVEVGRERERGLVVTSFGEVFENRPIVGIRVRRRGRGARLGGRHGARRELDAWQISRVEARERVQVEPIEATLLDQSRFIALQHTMSGAPRVPLCAIENRTDPFEPAGKLSREE